MIFNKNFFSVLGIETRAWYIHTRHVVYCQTTPPEPHWVSGGGGGGEWFIGKCSVADPTCTPHWGYLDKCSTTELYPQP